MILYVLGVLPHVLHHHMLPSPKQSSARQNPFNFVVLDINEEANPRGADILAFPD